LGKHFFTFLELNSTGNIEFFGELCRSLLLLDFVLTSFAFTLFEGAFLSQGIDLRLSVGSTFLEVTESLNFLFLLFLDLAFFIKTLQFHLGLSLLVGGDSEVSVLLSLGSFGLLL
jgi:hypothetical protein